jgi:hypothetical protein
LTSGRVQRLAEYLIRLSCRRLPADIGDERYREWTAELPAVLHDPDIRFQIRRDLRALRFAAGHARSSLRLPKARGWAIPVVGAAMGVVFIAIVSVPQAFMYYMFFPWFAVTVIEERKCLSRSAIRVALHPIRGDPAVRRWLFSFLVVISYAAYTASNVSREPWLPVVGGITGAAGLAMWLIPMIVARRLRATGRNRMRLP